MHLIYILYAQSINRFYTGQTRNIKKRLILHFQEVFPKAFTKKAKDWKLYLEIDVPSKEIALKIEKHIKSMKSSKYIIGLKENPERILFLKEKFR